MKKKIIKIINILFIFLNLFTPIFSYLNVNADTNTIVEYEKGDLRCPLNGKNCKEYDNNSDGKIDKVEITYGNLESDNVRIKKIVERTNKLGRLKVYFQVVGNNLGQLQTVGDVYIYVLLDMSSTMRYNDEEAISAVKTFSKKLINNKKGVTYYLAVSQFASNVKNIRSSFQNKDFSSTNFCGYHTCGMGVKSQVNKALQTANNAFKNVPEDAQKYVVLFGDGRYYNGTGSPIYKDEKSPDTNWTDTKKYRDALLKKGVTIYGIRYNSGIGDNNTFGKKRGECSGLKRKECDYRFMLHTIGDKKENYFFASNVSEYTTRFLEVADLIDGNVNSSSTTTRSNLIDKVGSNFTIDSDGGVYKRYSLGLITNKGITTEPFYITINPYSEDGWHDTNDGFTFSYTNLDGELAKLTCNLDPELYWVQERTELDSCSGVITAGEVQFADSDEYSFSKINCSEKNFTADIRINNLKKGIDKFDTKAGIGFPTDIKLSTKMDCEFVFDYNTYTKEYNAINNTISNMKNTLNQKPPKDPKERASLEKMITVTLPEQLEKLDLILTNYINKTKENSETNPLNAYKEVFNEQKATFKVIYNGNKEEEIEFINVNDASEKVKCTSNEVKKINGKEVIIKQNCSLSLKKDMQLPNVCLDMKTGVAKNCSDSNNEINGGNNFYTDLNFNGGSIFIDIPNATYTKKANLKLYGCSYTSGKMDILYRQIDVTDPFLENFNKDRKIGKNYINSDYKYDFTNIITDSKRTDGNTWSIEADYKFDFSKADINNIRKDTESVNDYLGKSCYFANNNKYICDFTRNIVAKNSTTN